MDITFIIGNGFDINCGLKCTYRDVYKGYVKEPSTSPVIATFKKNIASDIQTWADFEVAMAEYLPNFMYEKDFLLCLRDFKKYLSFHLKKEDEKFSKFLSDTRIANKTHQEMTHSFNTFYRGISHNLDHQIEALFRRSAPYFRVITFNYTSFFDKLYSPIKGSKEGKVLHIHGSLKDNDIVLGMDNLRQLPTAPFQLSARAERAFIKPMFNKAFDEDRFTKAVSWIQSSTIICVYGLSLGKSDFTWRNLLRKWLLEDNSRHLFLYDYSRSSLSNLTADEKLDYEDDTKEQLLASWKIPVNEQRTCFDRIHIPCGRNIFNIGTILQEELEKSETSEKSIKDSSSKVTAIIA